MKQETIVREIFIYPFSIILFPLLTIRILVWKWHFWLMENEKVIKNYHEKINNI